MAHQMTRHMEFPVIALNLSSPETHKVKPTQQKSILNGAPEIKHD
jgi:hypothetical protein